MSSSLKLAMLLLAMFASQAASQQPVSPGQCPQKPLTLHSGQSTMTLPRDRLEAVELADRGWVSGSALQALIGCDVERLAYSGRLRLVPNAPRPPAPTAIDACADEPVEIRLGPHAFRPPRSWLASINVVGEREYYVGHSGLHQRIACTSDPIVASRFTLRGDNFAKERSESLWPPSLPSEIWLSHVPQPRLGVTSFRLHETRIKTLVDVAALDPEQDRLIKLNDHLRLISRIVLGPAFREPAAEPFLAIDCSGTSVRDCQTFFFVGEDLAVQVRRRSFRPDDDAMPGALFGAGQLIEKVWGSRR